MSDITTTPSVQIANPRTGELVELNGTTDTLARFLVDQREQESRAREAKSLVTRELLERMDRAVMSGESAGWTVTVGDYTLKAPSPKPTVEYDVAALRSALMNLVAEGELAQAAVERAIETVVSYKVQRAALTVLCKSSPEVAMVVEAHERLTHRERRVTVERK